MSRKLNQFVLSLIGIVCWLTGSSASGAGLDVGGYQVISSTRVGRTDYQYVLTVNITNRVASAAGVTAQVYSLSTNTTIVQGTVSFGDVAFGAITVSSNTITIIQNRLAAFDPGQLQWFVAVKSMPLTVTVNSPVSGFLTGGTNVTVSGTVGPNVDGVLVGPNVAALTGTNYTGNFRLEEGKNTITVLATNSYGGSGIVNIFVTRDTTPPILNIESPTNGAVLSARQVTVIGLINDIVPGTVNPEQATVTVNGLDATLYNRSYAIQNILLVPGKNTITAVGRDRAGNQSQRQIEVTFTEPASQKRLVRLAGEAQTGVINTTLPLPLLVELVDSDGVVQTNQPVTFAIVRNDGTLFASPDTGRTLTVLTDDKGQARVFYQLGTRSGVANNQVDVTSPGVDGHVDFCANALGAPPTKISPLIPETQSGEVSRPLPLPWTAYITDAGGNPVASAPVTFVVSQGGGSFGGVTTVNTNTDSDGRAAVTLTLGPDEGVNNNIVLASVPGLSNSSAVFTASSQTPGAVADTRVVGVVLDNGNHPMSNILCMIRGSVRAAVTDQEGQFILTHAPVGAITLIIDGRNRGYPGEWHDLTFNMSTVAGRDNRLDRPIYMVQVDSASSMLVGGSQDVTLHLKDFPGASLTVYAHSLRDANNQPITNQVTWTQVNAERIPMAPPQGSQPVLTTAILPSGYRFNPPARMCIPNASGLPAGQILELYSFDHDIGSFVSVGTATVSADASLICSDPGFGVMKSGWHPVVPPPPPCTPVCGGPPADTDCIHYETVPPATKCDCPTYKPVQKVKITKLEAKANGKDEVVVGTNDTVNFSIVLEQENCNSPTYQWDFGDGETSTDQAPTHKYKEVKTFKPKVTVTCQNCGVSKSDDCKVIVTAPFIVIHKPKVIDAAEPEIPNADKLTKGAQTFVNLDNDDNGTKFDIDDATVAGEDEMIKVKLQIKNKDAKDGSAKLEATAGAGDIKVWKAADKGTEYALGSALAVPGDFTVSGDMLEKIVYVEGIKAQAAQQGTKLKFTYDKAAGTMDEAAVTIIGVESVAFEGKNNSRNDNNTLDADPNWPAGLVPAALRVFPDGRVSAGAVSAARDKVTVKAKLSVAPVEPLKLYFNSYDVDDPTTNAAPVDDDTANADDNRGTSPRQAGKIVGSDASGILELSFDSIEKTFEFQTTMQPGDNFRIVGNGDKDFFGNLENDDTKLGADNADKQRIVDKNVTGTPAEKEVREATKYVTPTLVVWRFLHVEVDSMAAPPAPTEPPAALPLQANVVDRVVSAIAGNATTATRITVSVNIPAMVDTDGDGVVDTADNSPTLPGGNGRFERGWVRVGPAPGTVTTNITGNGPDYIERAAGISVPFTLTRPSQANVGGNVTTLAGKVFTLHVTSGALSTNHSGGTLTVAGVVMTATNVVPAAGTAEVSVLGQIPVRLHDDDDDTVLPHTCLTTYMQASDAVANNLYAAAYIRPIYDGGGSLTNNTDNVACVLNTESAMVYAASRNSVGNNANHFWTVYVIAAFQDSFKTLQRDYDPDADSGTGGSTDGAVGGSLIYIETIRERGPTAGGGRDELESRIVVHEVGHAMTLDHGDNTDNEANNGIMNTSAQNGPRVGTANFHFIDAHLNRLRNLNHPRP